ncbi:MAG TPA: carboxypeptidase-like regulatory domain-containing protein, partial [Kofleriaceae bacterium]|nr:carboxypeptidase-like regulatory domain-containing protein [Kofleriaceae bacterium]
MAVAAAMAGVVVYLLVAVSGGDGAPAPRPGEKPAALGGGGGRTPWSDPPALTPKNGTGAESIGGSVTDAGGQPVAGVSISAEVETGESEDAGPGLGGQVVVAVTGADGAFELIGVEKAKYRLRVEGPGILTAEVRFVDAPGQGVRILVSREVRIEGWVIDQAGKAVDGVPVRAVGRGASAVEVVSGKDGAFAVEELAEGSYRVHAARGELASVAAPVDRLGTGPFLPVVLVLQPAAIIAGRVVDAQAAHGVAAEVTLVADDPDEPPRSARSAADGTFRIEGVPLGRWTADAFAPGYVSADRVQFEAASDYAPVIALERGGVVVGRVLDGEGRPVPGAVVVARPEGGGDEVSESAVARRSAGETAVAPAVGWQGGMVTATGLQFIPKGELGVVVGPLPFPPAAGTGAVRVAAPITMAAAAALPPLPTPPDLVSRFTTAADGTYRVAGLAPGRYRVAATHPDFADGTTPLLDMALGQERAGVDILLSSGVTLVGQVTDDRGAAVAGATVQARAREGAAPRHAITGPDGRYSLGPLAGRVQVQVSAAGFGTAARDVVAATGRTPVTREEHFILSRADAALEGRITDATGFAVRGATVRVAGGPATAAPAQTDDAGRFRVPGLPVGRYVLRVEHPDYPPVELDARTGVGNQLELDFGGRLTGQVRDRSTSAPIAGVAVALRGPRGARAQATSGAAGEIAAGPLAAGRWTLEASARGYARAAATADVTAGRRPGDVTARDVHLDLVRSATLAGTVRDHNGERVAGAQVTAGAVTATYGKA